MNKKYFEVDFDLDIPSTFQVEAENEQNAEEQAFEELLFAINECSRDITVDKDNLRRWLRSDTKITEIDALDD